MRWMLLLFCVISTNSSAAVLNFEYQGPPLICSDNRTSCPYDEGFFGSIVIDESLYPCGSIASTTLTLSSYFLEKSYQEYEVVTATDVFSGRHGLEMYNIAPGGEIDHGPLLFAKYTGIIRRFADVTVSRSSFRLEFDANSEVQDWYGDGTGGVDPMSRPLADNTSIGFGRGPGIWTRTVVSLSPVPLPSSLMFMLMVLLGLFGPRRCVHLMLNAR